ncbi:MAG: hypothetical protein CMF43_05975 [Legionellales bacterium]|nr:hypothetical protein [Legionellales bacterium]
MNNKLGILIPARMESVRFPGKPLAPIAGTPMVLYCAENAKKTGYPTYVCTDSKDILSVCKTHDVNCIKTPQFNTGTDRVAWSAKELGLEFIVNLQGDEPLITSQNIGFFIKKLLDSQNEIDKIQCGVTKIGPKEAFDPNNVKCAISFEMNKILYFSRKPLLCNDDDDLEPYFKQIGLYGMTFRNLHHFTSLEQGKLELCENVELLRWIENDKIVDPCLLNVKNISVDSPADLYCVNKILNES